MQDEWSEYTLYYGGSVLKHCMFCMLSNLLWEKVYFVIPGCFAVIIVFILIVFIIFNLELIL